MGPVVGTLSMGQGPKITAQAKDKDLHGRAKLQD